MVIGSLPCILADTEGTGGDRGPADSYAPWWDFGWKYRRPITIDNTNNANLLKDFQVMVPLNTAEMISAGKMRSDCGDARFTDADGVSELGYFMEDKGLFWVRVPTIPASSTSNIYVYFGNPSATTTSNGSAAFDLYDDFESYGDGTTIPNWQEVSGDWIITTPSGKTRAVRLDDAGSSSALIKSASYSGARTIEADIADETFTSNVPHPGIVVGYQDANNYNAIYWRSQSAQLVRWQVNGGTETGTDITPASTLVGAVAGTYHRMKVTVDASGSVLNVNFLNYNTTPGFAVQTTGVGLWQHRTGTEIGWCDNFRVRKYTSPEPSSRLGAEELPFALISVTFSPARMSVGDTVFFNATFNNPTTEMIKLPLGAREADNFTQTSDYFFEQEVWLAPSADTTVPFCWTAAGGPRTIWLAISGYPLASTRLNVNRDPVIAAVKDQSLWQDRDFLLQVNATDQDGDPLSWSIDNALFNISGVSNRSAEISILPTNDDVGVHRANITVRDTMNRTDTRRINFTVNNVNDPPGLEKIPSLSATQYKELRYKAKATDPDVRWGDIVTYSDNTDLFEIDARTGEFVFTPVEEHVGKHNVKVTVTDTAGASVTTVFTITVVNVNDPPTLEILPPQFALQGRLFQLKIVAADPDMKSDTTEKLGFSDDSQLFNMNNDTGMISFTPTNDQIGVWMANITVTDKGGLSNTTSLTITVMNANDPPAVDAIPPQTAAEDATFNYQVNATDPDLKWGQDNLTFADDTDLFNIDPRTGAISFTPTGAQTGIKRVTITVKDDKGASASASFDLSVVHLNHAPFDVAIRHPLDGSRLKEGEAMYLDGTAKDYDKGDTLQYFWFDNDAAVGSGRNISVKLGPGTHAIRLEVSDGTETASSSVSVQVEKKQTVPVTSSGSSILPVAAAAAAVFAIVAVVAVLAMRRRRTSAGPEASAEARGPQARALIDSTVDRLADHQEANPEQVLDLSPVMEKLDMAREMLRTGEPGDALDFARQAKSEAARLLATPAPMAPLAPSKVAVKRKRVHR
jgi:hypothetical protein